MLLKRLFKNKFIITFLVSIFFVVGVSPVSSQIPTSNVKSSNPRLLVQKGEELYRQQELSTALKYFQKAADIFEQQEDRFNQAITLTNLGRLQLELGHANNALNNWQTSEKIYFQLGDKTGITRSKIYQSSALQDLGMFPNACETLLDTFDIQRYSCNDWVEEKFEKILIQKKISQQSNLLLLTGWRNLGDILRSMGKLDESIFILETVAKTDTSQFQATVSLSLGNSYAANGNLKRDILLAKDSKQYNYQPWGCFQNDGYLAKEAIDEYEKAESSYKKAIQNLQEHPTAIKAKINLINLLLMRGKFQKSNNQQADNFLSQAKTLLSEIKVSNLPPSQNRFFTQINLAKSQVCLSQLTNQQPDWDNVFKQLTLAKTEADKLNNNVAKSYVIGNLGGFYNYRAWWLEQNLEKIKKSKDTNSNLCPAVDDCLRTARKLTVDALSFDEALNKPFIAYQWQSQLGSILEKQNKKADAISAYNGAIKSLESVRFNLSNIDSDVQFSFLENIEPVYRRLLNLLLQSQASKVNLSQATQVSESLQLAELENLLKCRLNTLETTSINQLDKQPTAIIHPILFQDRIEVIVQKPAADKFDFQRFTSYVSQSEINEIVNRLDIIREPSKFPKEDYIKEAQRLYDILLKPAQNYLPNDGTLVFIVDSTLQNVPFAVLNDGQQYLVEKYSIAASLTSELPSQLNTQSKQRNALLVGISEKAQSYPENLSELPYVDFELDGIENTVSNQTLRNENFSKKALTQQMTKATYSFIHLATHGKFSSNREQTYIYAWDEKIKLNDLDELLRNRRNNTSQPIDLLVLSACETAKGDKRAALGIAGVALKAEARSTVASLWTVNDKSTADFMKLFYEELGKPNTTKAEAIRNVQLLFLKNSKYSHPYHWAPFILVGSWI